MFLPYVGLPVPGGIEGSGCRGGRIVLFKGNKQNPCSPDGTREGVCAEVRRIVSYRSLVYLSRVTPLTLLILQEVE